MFPEFIQHGIFSNHNASLLKSAVMIMECAAKAIGGNKY